MDKTLRKDLDHLHELLQASLEEGLHYLDALNDLPTSVPNPEIGRASLPDKGKGGLQSLKEFRQRFKALMAASAGPRYWGFVTGGTTPAALMGDMLAGIFDQNTLTFSGQGDISGIVERETVELLRELFELPRDFLGGFVTGATMSNFTCLGVARQWMGKQAGVDIARNGIRATFPILSAVPHSSAIKALSMLGIGSTNIQLVKTIDATREAVDLSALEAKIQALDGQPFVLISSGGTVNTVDFDDMKGIARLRARYRFWWHVDAAFGGYAAVSPDHKHLLEGWEQADSITIDGHKWLNVPYESAFFFVKEQHRYLQVETFQNSNAPYLGDPLERFDYLNFLPENSRRFKALPAWFTLKAYGKAGYREIVERNILQARQLGDFIDQAKDFELLSPVRLNTVCFSLAGEHDAARVREFLQTLNARGRVFMTPTVFNGRAGIRAALVNWRTTDRDIELVEAEMKSALEHTLKMSC